MLGLDAAGKTTILYKLHIGEVLSTVPTIGSYTFLHFFSLFLYACFFSEIESFYQFIFQKLIG